MYGHAVRRALCFFVCFGLCAFAPAVAGAAPTITSLTSCAVSPGRVAVFGRDFTPGERLTLDVVAMAIELGAAPIVERATTVDAQGAFVEVFDTPDTPTGSIVERTIRARRSADPGPSAQPLATAPLRLAGRGLEASSAEPELVARTTQHWRLTGLPVGMRLYAHYRRAGKTVTRVALGRADDLCGRLEFDLRVLPRGDERRGAWELWMTADRTFRRPRKGVYVHQRMRVSGSTPGAHVKAARPQHRLTPIDPRFSEPVTNAMSADATKTGVISLDFVGAAGATVEFLERVGDRLVRVGTATSGADDIVTTLKEATTWSCDRLERSFVGSVATPDGATGFGAFTTRTPSCAHRFELNTPRSASPGADVRVRIVDRWSIGGIAPQLCITPPSGRRACRDVRLARAVTSARQRFRARARGRWRVELRVRDRAVAKQVVTVGRGGAAPPAPPTILATGDSTMQGIDVFLADELGDRARVVSDVRPGTGITKSSQFTLPGADTPGAIQWALLADEQTARLRPRATILSIGSNEGFPMTTPDGARVGCCEAPWQQEYSRRAQLMMASYAGTGRVLWLALPLPLVKTREAITRAVNAAILAAAAGNPQVEVLRLDEFFTPDGFRDVMRYRGRDIHVRDPDGLHLSIAGTAIAARLVAAALRAAGVVAPAG